MDKIFYIADTHFGHKNIISFDNRPFFDTKDMEDSIVENWNKVVDWGDRVYIIGDAVWDVEEVIRIQERLNGYLYLVTGNHDDTSRNCYEGIYKNYAEIEDNGRHVVLCHYPIMFYKNMTNPNWYHLYGHVHAAWDHNMTENWRKQIEALYLTEWKGYNVGCMMPYMNYTPRTLDEIIAGARKMRGLPKA